MEQPATLSASLACVLQAAHRHSRVLKERHAATPRTVHAQPTLEHSNCVCLQRSFARLSVSATPGAGAGVSVSLGSQPQAANPFVRASAPARASGSSDGIGDGDVGYGGGSSPPAGLGGGGAMQLLPPDVRSRLGAHHHGRHLFLSQQPLHTQHSTSSTIAPATGRIRLLLFDSLRQYTMQHSVQAGLAHDCAESRNLRSSILHQCCIKLHDVRLAENPM